MTTKISLALRRAVTAILSTLALAPAVRAQMQAPTQTMGQSQPRSQALRLTYGADVGVGETDNVTLSSTDRVSQTMAVADLDFDVRQLSRRLDLDARGNFSYLDYLQGAFGNQLLGRFDGVGRFGLIPERLTWTVQDNFGQGTLDPFAPTTPGNLENVNYFTTGPDLNLRLGGSSFLNLSARYARVTYETSPFNSNRLMGSLGWGMQLSANSSISLNAQDERVLFQDTAINTDFNRTNAFLDYTLSGARTSLSADGGASRVNQEGQIVNGAFARLKLERVISRSSRLTFEAGRDLTDASASFSALGSGATGVVGSAPAAQSAATYTNTYAGAGWQYERNRTLLAVSGRWERNEYDSLPLFDFSRRGAELRLARKLSHSFSAEIDAHVYKTSYPNAALGAAAGAGSADYTDGGVAGVVSWRHGRGLEIKLRAEHGSRAASGVDNGYHENRAFLTVGYRPRPAELAESVGPAETVPQ